MEVPRRKEKVPLRQVEAQWMMVQVRGPTATGHLTLPGSAEPALSRIFLHHIALDTCEEACADNRLLADHAQEHDRGSRVAPEDVPDGRRSLDAARLPGPVLLKPFSGDELLGVIGELLAR